MNATQIASRLLAWTRPVSLATIAVALVLLAISFATERGGVTAFGSKLGADFHAFYLAGQILNTEPERLHDLSLQIQRYHENVPRANPNEFSAFSYTPFFAVIFRPFALLPFAWAFLLWLPVSAGLYLTGLWLTWKSQPDWTANKTTTLLVATAYTPFLIEGWINGQMVGVIIFIIGLSLYLRSRDRALAAGMVLAVLAFKPTLLVLLVPMLLVSRQFRVFTGMMLGGLTLGLVSLWAVKWHGCLQYVHFLRTYEKVRRSAPDALLSWKYVDLRAALPSQGAALTVMLAILALLIGIMLIRAWRQSDTRWSWALALAWTPVLNLHCAIYDTVLLVPAAMLTADRTRSPLLMLIYVTAWVSQPIARYSGFQPITFTILLFGLCLLHPTARKSVEMAPWADATPEPAAR